MATRQSVKVFSVEHNVSLKNKFRILLKRKKGMHMKQARGRVSDTREFKDRNVFLNFFTLPFQRTDDSRKTELRV